MEETKFYLIITTSIILSSLLLQSRVFALGVALLTATHNKRENVQLSILGDALNLLIISLNQYIEILTFASTIALIYIVATSEDVE